MTWPEAQSAVAQLNFPLLLEHPVRAQNRPDHGDGRSKEFDAPGPNSKPVDDNWGFWSPVRVPGHTVNEHLFMKVTFAPSDTAYIRNPVYVMLRTERKRETNVTTNLKLDKPNR